MKGEQQLRLFEHPKPLLERLGAAFFRAVPKGPGVYVMCGGSGQILYVGQSANLRTRLGSYRSANPDHVSRRVIRLVHAVETITWEPCESAELARVRENELLRLYRPKFNRMNVYPRAYWFIGMELSDDRLKFLRTTEAREGVTLFGAFKGVAIYGFASLLRLLWSAIYRPLSPFDLPRQLVDVKPPMQFAIDLRETPAGCARADIVHLIHDYYEGASPEIIVFLKKAVGNIQCRPLFYERYLQADIDTLTSFYAMGPARNRRLKEENAIHDRLIPQEDLDDWIALSDYRRTGIGSRAGVDSAMLDG